MDFITLTKSRCTFDRVTVVLSITGTFVILKLARI